MTTGGTLDAGGRRFVVAAPVATKRNPPRVTWRAMLYPHYVALCNVPSAAENALRAVAVSLPLKK